MDFQRIKSDCRVDTLRKDISEFWSVRSKRGVENCFRGLPRSLEEHRYSSLHEGSYRLPDYCTVFQAELTAITEACTHLTSNNNKHIIIWTDSLSSIQAITTLNIKSRTVGECLIALNHLRTTNTLELRWIAAHTGIWGNEKADELAKLGTTTSPPLTRPIPQCHINDYINNNVAKLNQDHWNNNAPRHTKMTLGRRRNPTKIINNLNTSLISNRKDYRTAIHLITGHCGLNKHLNNMNKTDTKECLLCWHQEETVSHFLSFSANVQLSPSSEDATSTTTTSLSTTFSITFTYHQLLALLIKPTDFSNLKTSTTQEWHSRYQNTSTPFGSWLSTFGLLDSSVTLHLNFPFLHIYNSPCIAPLP